MKYKVVGAGKKLPDLSHPAKGVAKYLVVVFQDVRDYHSMEAGPRAVLDSHCRHFKVGILAFVPAGRDKMTEEEVMDNVGTNRSSSIRATSHLTLTSAVTSDHALLRILKQNLTITSPRPAASWVRLGCAGPGCVPVISAGFSDGSRGPVVVEDPGHGDGVLKVLVGGGHVLHFWFMKLVVLDALHHLSRGEVSLPLTRYLMVDIDDIFVGVARLATSDVSALVDSQVRALVNKSSCHSCHVVPLKTHLIHLKRDENEDELLVRVPKAEVNLSDSSDMAFLSNWNKNTAHSSRQIIDN